MNKRLEEAIADLRCANKPVKSISKKLGVKKDDIEKVIKQWIICADQYIGQLVKDRRALGSPPKEEMLELAKLGINEMLKNGAVLDYIARNRSDYHDRFMDCIRHKICIMIKNSKR